MNAIKVFFCTLGACCTFAILGGCASQLTPVIEDHSHSSWPMSRTKVAVFSTTAARREVLVRYQKDNDQAFICAEAPPDTADAISSSLSLLAQTQLGNEANQNSVNATLDLTKDIANSVRALYTRSQGEQMFRDGAFHLCLAAQNELIGGADYVRMYEDLLERSSKLISEELPLMQVTTSQTAAENAEASADDAEKAATKAVAAQAAAEAAAGKVKAAGQPAPN